MFTATAVGGTSAAGQRMDDVYAQVRDAEVLTIGANWPALSGQVNDGYQLLANMCNGWCHAYVMVGDGEDPDTFASKLVEYGHHGMVSFNFVGGWNASPAHIEAVSKVLESTTVRTVQAVQEAVQGPVQGAPNVPYCLSAQTQVHALGGWLEDL